MHGYLVSSQGEGVGKYSGNFVAKEVTFTTVMCIIVLSGSGNTCLNNAWCNMASATHGSPMYSNTNDYELKPNILF